MRRLLELGQRWLNRCTRCLSSVLVLLFILGAGVQERGWAQSRPEILLELGAVSESQTPAVAFLPDGEHLVSFCNAVRLWRIDRVRNELRYLRTLPANFQYAYPSPDGRYWVGVVRTDNQAHLVMRHTLSNTVVFEVMLPFSPSRVVISRDGQYLAVEGEQRVQVWRWANNQLLYDLDNFGALYLSVAFSNDGQYLYVLGNGLHRLRLSDGTIETIRHDGIHGSLLVLSPRDDYIAYCQTSTVFLLRTSDGSEVFQQRVPHQGANMTFSADGRLLMIPVGVGVLGVGVPDRVWRVILRNTGDRYAAFSPDGELFACIGPWKLEVWRSGEWTCIGSARRLQKPALSPDEQLVATWVEEPSGSLRLPEYRTHVFRVVDGQRVANVFGGQFPTFSPDGRYLVTESRRGTEFYRVSDWQPVYTFERNFSYAAYQVPFFSSDGQNVAIRTYLGAFFLRTDSWQGYLHVQRSVVPVGDGEQFVEVESLPSGGQWLHFRRIADGVTLRTVFVPLRYSLLAVSLDGSTVVGYWDSARQLAITRITEGIVHIIQCPDSASAVCFTPDSRYLVAGGRFGVWFVRVSDLRRVLEYTPETLGAGVESIDFSLLGRAMCYERSDGTVVVARNPFYQQGDVNGDGCVDGDDLVAVLSAFGTQGSAPTRPEDLDRNGIVDDADLLTVLFEFGGGC